MLTEITWTKVKILSWMHVERGPIEFFFIFSSLEWNRIWSVIILYGIQVKEKHVCVLGLLFKFYQG